MFLIWDVIHIKIVRLVLFRDSSIKAYAWVVPLLPIVTNVSAVEQDVPNVIQGIIPMESYVSLVLLVAANVFHRTSAQKHPLGTT